MLDKEINLTELDCINRETFYLLEKTKVLKHIINRLIISELIKNVDYDNSIVNKLKEATIKRKNFKTKEDFFNWLEESNLTEESFWEDIINTIKYDNFCIQNFGHKTESIFLTRQDDLCAAIYSLITLNDDYLANELYQRIKNNESNFGDLASEFSMGKEKITKGLIGPVSISVNHPTIIELIKTKKVGEVTEPIRLDKNLVIIFRLEAFEKAVFDYKTKLDLSKELFKSWLAKESISKIHSLKVKYGKSSK